MCPILVNFQKSYPKSPKYSNTLCQTFAKWGILMFCKLCMIAKLAGWRLTIKTCGYRWCKNNCKLCMIAKLAAWRFTIKTCGYRWCSVHRNNAVIRFRPSHQESFHNQQHARLWVVQSSLNALRHMLILTQLHKILSTIYGHTLIYSFLSYKTFPAVQWLDTFCVS